MEIPIIGELLNLSGDGLISSVITVLIFFIIYLVIFSIFKGYVLVKLKEISKKTSNNIDDIAIDIIYSIKGYSYYSLAVLLSLNSISLSDKFGSVVDVLLFISIAYIIVSAVSVLTDNVVNILVERSKKSGADHKSLITASTALRTLIKAIIWLSAIVTVLSNLGVNVTSLIAGLGIGGIAIAFALQKDICRFV